MASWKNLFGTKSRAAVTDAGDATLQHPTAVLVDPVTGQPPVGGQPVNILPLWRDQGGTPLTIPANSGATPVALPAGATRVHLFSDVPCYLRFGNSGATATTASGRIMGGVPYDLALRAGETYVSAYGMGTAGTLQLTPLDAA